MSSEQRTLNYFVEQHGTTENFDLEVYTKRNDGHLYEVNEIDDYWRGTRELNKNGYWPLYSLVPAGNLVIVLDEDAVKRGWPADDSLQTGVYLTGTEDISNTHPPHPMAVNDEWLKFGAEACLRAADGICSGNEIVAISKTSWGATLTVTVRDGEKTRLFNGTSSDSIPAHPEEQPELYRGFYLIRQRSAPAEVYTKCDVPRMALSDLSSY